MCVACPSAHLHRPCLQCQCLEHSNERPCAHALHTQRFDDGAQDAPKKGLTADQKREKEREKWRRERAAVAKAVKAKKVAVFRNITAMKFVEDTEAKTKEREK